MSSYHIHFTDEEAEIQGGDLSCSKEINGRSGIYRRAVWRSESMVMSVLRHSPSPGGRAVLFSIYRRRYYNVFMHPKPWTSPPPKLGLSCAITLPCLLFSALFSWTAGELAPTPIWACLILAGFLPRAQPPAPPELGSLLPDLEAAWSSTEGLIHRLSSMWPSFLIYEMEVILSPPKVEWNHLCQVLSTGHVSWGGGGGSSHLPVSLKTALRPPSLQSLGESLGFVSSLDAVHCHVQGHVWNQASFFSPHPISQGGRVLLSLLTTLAEIPACPLLLPHFRTGPLNRIFWGDGTVLDLCCPKWKPVATSGYWEVEMW